MGHGFHEDGFNAGMQVARRLLAPPEKHGLPPVMPQLKEFDAGWTLGDEVCRAIIRVIQLLIDVFQGDRFVHIEVRNKTSRKVGSK